ncbi:MAG: alanine racemase [Spirochaetae bacterium HGW-Spirochaetae-5]|nr:MAG: alanine racemase [Spirochaetae bacterium HGW-Spirochaetae-5]
MIQYSSDSPTYTEIDMEAFRHNISEIRRILNPGTEIIAVVKADAYGHGAEMIACEAVANGAAFLAVARLNEAIHIRDCGIDAPILLFDDCVSGNTARYIELNIRPTVSTFEEAEMFSVEASACQQNIKVHIKVDTGMGRLGFLADGLTSEQCYYPLAEEIKKISELPFIEIEGVYSHFANSDVKDKTHAREQLIFFLKLKNDLDNLLTEKPLYHMANSAGIMEIPESHFDLVRPGIIMYGQYPSDEVDKSKIDLKPVMSFKSKIIHVKTVAAGFKVSYGSTFVTDRETVIATVPAGYADGLSRLLSSKGDMLVRGKRAPILGRVCMDLTMIDVTNIDGVSLNDQVVIIGSQGNESITADEIAVKTGTINYEVLTSIAPRVTRRFVNV